jgi:DNA-binding NtrC family response regulator
MARLWSHIRLLAPHFRIALLSGETGCGAEAVANALHNLSGFSDAPLVTVRAIDAERQLRSPSILFGGGARGVLFIPEIDRLSTAGQQAVLRLVRMRRHRRIALIASCSRDLHPLVSAGSFHAELASLLSSLRISIPALRERVEDIPLLLSHLMQAEAERLSVPRPALEPGFLAAITEFSWPSNIAQLRATTTWLLENRHQASLSAADLQAALAEAHYAPEPDVSVRMVPLDHVVQEHVRAVLIGCNGNKLRAAEVLGISRSTLYRMLETTGAHVGPASLALVG